LRASSLFYHRDSSHLTAEVPTRDLITFLFLALVPNGIPFRIRTL